MRYGAGFGRIALAVMLLLGPGAVARAQEEEEEGPGRGVARVSLINGDVSVRRGDSGDWVAAAVNAPLVVQDTIATGSGSRTEVQFDRANMLRLGSNAEVRLSELEYNRYQVQVARGTVEFRVLRDSEAEVEVNTPAVSVRPRRRGAYRITVYEDGRSEITVRAGEVEVYTPRGVENLPAGRTMLVRNEASGPEYQIAAAPESDDFDRWNEQRDRVLERSESYRYVSSSIYGADDLDGHGRWVYDPPYGWVWAPSVGAGWAPYRHGRWAWVDWYGWTWVSYDSWGWAPFHYGRWYWGGQGWCWYPGGIHSRHYWRPALVGFFGFGGPGLHVGIGFGRVGWVPLAPYERYHPWYGNRYYGRGGHMDRSGHITNNINITNVYRNARIRDGISGMEAGHFGRRGNISRVGEHDIRQASLVRGQLPVGPGRESVRFADREVRRIPRSNIDNTRFYSRRQPSQVERVPFADQQRSFNPRSQPINRVAAESGRGTSTENGRGAWRRFGEPARNMPRNSEPQRSEGFRSPESRSAEPNGVTRTQQDGWRRFGQSGNPTRTENAPIMRNTEGRGQGGRAPTRTSDTPVMRNTEGQGGRGNDHGRWQRFGEPSSVPRAQSENRTGFEGSRSREFSMPRNEQRTERFGSRPESIRISPPVVRERSMPRMESAPRTSHPERYSAPRSEGRMSGGGGGGSMSRQSAGAAPRSSGGGGGGGHSGGGGRAGGRNR